MPPGAADVRDAPVPETLEVLDRERAREGVVDDHVAPAPGHGTMREHARRGAVDEPRHERMVGPRRQHEHPVDTSGLQEHLETADLGTVLDDHDGQVAAGRSADGTADDPGVDAVRQVGNDHRDAAGGAAAQRARRGIGAIAQLLGRGVHALPGLLANGDRRAVEDPRRDRLGDAGPVRHVIEARSRRAGHGGTAGEVGRGHGKLVSYCNMTIDRKAKPAPSRRLCRDAVRPAAAAGRAHRRPISTTAAANYAERLGIGPWSAVHATPPPTSRRRPSVASRAPTRCGWR